MTGASHDQHPYPGRRAFLTHAGLGVGALAASALPERAVAQPAPAKRTRSPSTAAPGQFWPDGARLVISISMQFEAGGEPDISRDGPLPPVDFPAGVIGAALTRGLADGGATVVGADLSFPNEAGVVDGVEQVSCDVSRPEAVKITVDGIRARHGDVEILVNNAAMVADVTNKPFEEISADEWSKVMTVNTLAPFLCSQAVAPAMRARRWGRIINLTSAVIYQAVPNLLNYTSSKGAVAVLTRSLARELGRDGITVNGIAPGLTITEGIARNSGYSQQLRDGVIKARCIPREERAEDLVGACLFLASDGAEFMTGQVLVVDGRSVFP